MTKYIIKNCPALLISGICNGRNVKGLACKNNTDCLLKSIVEKAKNASPYNFLSDDILKMLAIKECK